MGTTPALQASIRNRPRRRWRGQPAATVALLTSWATAAWLAVVGTGGRLVVVERPVPTTDTRPAAPAAATWADLGPCPHADARGDLPVGTATADDDVTGVLDGEALIGAAASVTRRGALATWTEDTIFVSSDDGQRFEPVLPGPGKVRAVAIDCHGRVFALRVLEDDDSEREPAGMMLGVRHLTREAWRSVDFFTEHAGREPHLVADRGVVAIAGPVAGGINEGLLAVSADGGATWRFDPLEMRGSWEGAAAIDIDSRGVVRVLSRWGDCMSEGSTVTRFDPASGTTTSTEVAAHPYGPAALDGDGWAYGVEWAGGELRGWHGEETRRTLDGWRTSRPAADDEEHSEDQNGDEPAVDVVSNGTTVYALGSGELARLRDGGARWIAGDLPMARAMAVDGVGRIVGLTADDGLVRWSPRYGARHLGGQPRD